MLLNDALIEKFITYNERHHDTFLRLGVIRAIQIANHISVRFLTYLLTLRVLLSGLEGHFCC
jgi:hypothetical protein